MSGFLKLRIMNPFDLAFLGVRFSISLRVANRYVDITKRMRKIPYKKLSIQTVARLTEIRETSIGIAETRDMELKFVI